jgi:CheY-like chemotaxis protein
LRSSAEALLTIINDVLDFSKIEAGKLSIEPIHFDLHVALEDMIDLMNTKAREKGLDLILRIAPETPRHVIGDAGRVRQILINLLGNAIKFTAEGHVYLNVNCVRQAEHDADVRFSVEDTGIGIPADKLEHIFERFTQADTSTTRRFGGTGLGLAICKQLTELMGGTIGVESRPAEGSIFYFVLTFARGAEPTVAPPRQADLTGVRILIVDDNRTNQFVLREQLNARGLNNFACNNGVEAMEALQSARSKGDPFQIAILDQQMPGINGESLARKIKADQDLKDTVLVMLTSIGAPGDAARMKEAGFAAYLTKPARHSQLLEALVTVWDSRKREQSAPLVTRHSLAESRAVEPALSEPTQPVHLSRVLLVEDNSVNQKVATRLLEKLGCRVDVAANGREAVDTLANLPYDVVFMDCQMPEMDGFEATREIRRREGEKSRIPIIAMTANALQGDRERCLQAGMDDYVSKPIRPAALAEALERHLPERSQTNKPSPERSKV